jgi:hypothetical protein
MHIASHAKQCSFIAARYPEGWLDHHLIPQCRLVMKNCVIFNKRGDCSFITQICNTIQRSRPKTLRPQ